MFVCSAAVINAWVVVLVSCSVSLCAVLLLLFEGRGVCGCVVMVVVVG